MSKLTRVGCTPVTEDLTVVYYISSLDDSGRDIQWGHTKDEAEAQRAFELAKETEYDMQLYVGLFKDYESYEQILIDAEVLDTFSDEETI